MDKAGAVYDAAWDEDVWRTAENGKRYQIDTETGEIKKGNVGQPVVNRESRPVESSKPDTARYEPWCGSTAVTTRRLRMLISAKNCRGGMSPRRRIMADRGVFYRGKLEGTQKRYGYRSA